jgi:cytochrome P450
MQTYADAEKTMGRALVEAMQLRPSPELVWRTAKRPHKLGNVNVEKGELVVVSIVSAMQQCLESKDDDIYAVFGGKREGDSPPTHACPGYKMAMGVLMGILSAFLEVKGSMRASPAPLAFTFEGVTTPEDFAAEYGVKP